MKEMNSPESPSQYNETAIPAELFIDNTTSRFGLRAAAFRRLGVDQKLVAFIRENEFHLVGRVIPGGRALLFGGAGVLAIAGVGGAVVLCRHLYKHSKSHQKLHQEIEKKYKKKSTPPTS